MLIKKFLVSSNELFCEKGRYLFLQYPGSSTFWSDTGDFLYKVCVAAASYQKPNDFGNGYPIWRWSWYITANFGEIDNYKIKVVLFVKDSGPEMTAYAKFELQIISDAVEASNVVSLIFSSGLIETIQKSLDLFWKNINYLDAKINDLACLILFLTRVFWNSVSYANKERPASWGAQFFPIEITIIC